MSTQDKIGFTITFFMLLAMAYALGRMHQNYREIRRRERMIEAANRILLGQSFHQN